MSGRVHAEAQAAPKSSFSPVRTGLLAGSRVKSLVSQPPLIQAKLTINQPGDRYEQEADRVADVVMRMPEAVVQREVEPGEEEEEEILQTKPLVDQITPLVQRQVEEEEEEEMLQAKELSGQTSEVTPNLESRINAIRGGGQHLPAPTRAFFEPRFGYNFTQVRVHTDAEANTFNHSLNARAFTIGQDIFFSHGEYNSGSSSGQELLAHELTHVVQQNGDKFQRNFAISRSSPNMWIQRGLREDYKGSWISAMAQLNNRFIAVGGIIDIQKGAVQDFARYAAATDQPSVAQQVLIGVINLVLRAVIRGVGSAMKAIAQTAVRQALRNSVGAMVDSMVDAGKNRAQQAVRDAWDTQGASEATRLAQFVETQRRGLESIGQHHAEHMNQRLAGLRSTNEDDAWAAANALYQAFGQSLQTAAYNVQFNKMTDIWFTMQTGTVGTGARHGVLQIMLERRYPNSGMFRISGGNLLGSGATQRIRSRMARRPLREITIPKVVLMNGQMGYGIMDCNWQIHVTGQELPSANPTIRAPETRSRTELFMAVPQHVVDIRGHAYYGLPWLAAYHLGLDDLSSSDPRNSSANRAAGSRAIWAAVENLTPGTIGSSSR